VTGSASHSNVPRGWVGKSTALLEPLADAIGRHVLAGQAIFADETPVKMLAPGTGKTAAARLRAYGRDERPWGSSVPPASWHQFSPDRGIPVAPCETNAPSS